PSIGENAPLPRGKQPTLTDDADRERFVAALHKLLIERGVGWEWDADKERLLARYERLIRAHKDLRVGDNIQDKLTVAAISVLAERSADRIEGEVRKALSNKGFSDRLIKAACEHVHEQFVDEKRP